jgi:benzoylformate decarboxylase
MAECQASDLILDQLAAEGSKLVFVAPGLADNPIYSAISRRADIKFAFNVHAGAAVGAANGYAEVSAKTGVVMLSSSGLAHVMPALAYVMAARNPLVLVALCHESRNPLKHNASDQARLAEPFCKWVADAQKPDELPLLIRQAFHEAFMPPRGPAMVLVPDSLLTNTLERRLLLPPKVSPLGLAEPSVLKRTTQLLVSASCPAIIAGNEIVQFQARKETVALAEVLGCPVFSEQSPRGLLFPNFHPQFAGVLPPDRELASQMLSIYDVILMAGVQNRGPFDSRGQGPIPANAVVVQINCEPSLAGASQPCHFGGVANLTETLARLRVELQLLADNQWVIQSKARMRQTIEAISSHRQVLAERFTPPALDADIPVAWLLSYLDGVRPRPSSIVNDTGRYSDLPLILMKFDNSSEYFGGMGRMVGWGLPVASGVQFANPNHTVVCLTTEEALLSCPQSLYTAASYGLPLKTVVLNRNGYRPHAMAAELMDTVADDQPEIYERPAISFVELARAFAVPANAVSKVSSVAPLIREMFETAGPYLLDVQVQT